MKLKEKTKFTRGLVTFLIICYAVTVGGLAYPGTRDLFTGAIPFILIVSVVLLFWYHGKFTRQALLAGILIFLAGFLVEAAGVSAGIPFGEYHFGTALGPRVLHTPLLTGINWLFLVYCCAVIAGRFVEPLYFRSLVAGAMIVVYDFALEPSATWLGMWHWDGGAVPLQNYLARFVLAVALTYLAGAMRLPDTKNKLAGPLFFIQLAFFIVLDFWIVAEKIGG
jgi:uncharacterized membrane protein